MVKRNKYMNVPEIRFKGLDKTWNKKTLDELVQLNSGMDYKHLCNGNIPVYGTGGYMLSVNAALSYDKDAIGIGRKGTINKPYILKAPFWTVDTLFYAIPRKYNNLQFCNCIFQRIDWLKYDESTGVPSLSKNIINSIEVNCAPSYDEQQKIASYFQSLDSLIQTTSKKLVSLKQIKDASLQSMFPQEGETVPKVRFKGFEGEWEEKSFSALYKKSIIKNDLTFGTDKIISVANMYYLTNVNVSDLEYLKTYNIMKLGDIAFEGNKSKRFLHGRFVENTIGDGIVSHVFVVFHPISAEHDINYWKYAINNENIMRNVLIRCTKSSTMMTDLVVDDFLKETILVPTYAEQQKIGAYFRNLDRQISLQTQRLEKLKQIKAACLDKMFV